MNITYATAHTWYKKLTEGPETGLSEDLKGRLRKLAESPGYQDTNFAIEPLSQTFLEQFVPLYTESLKAKENPKIHDVAGTTIHKGNGLQYFSLGLNERGAFKGGTIFSLRDDSLSVAYRAYDQSWDFLKARATPSLYSEYLLCKHALENGKKLIMHGKDRNPYGKNASIGLALFKLSMGCFPRKSKSFELEKLETSNETKDLLILKYPQSGEDIKEAILLVDEDGEKKWGQVAKYPHLLNVEVVRRT